MSMRFRALAAVLLCGLISSAAQAADVVPTEIQQPGTQPNEVGNFELRGAGADGSFDTADDDLYGLSSDGYSSGPTSGSSGQTSS